MEQWIIDLQKKYAAPPSKKSAPADRGQFNRPAPKADEGGLHEQCKQCDIGAHCRGGERNCGCWCARDGRE